MNSKDSQNPLDQNPALSVSRLKYKLAKLQLALKDKDAELIKLNSSTKATSMHEMRLQTQVYYDEVIRLLNQISIMQDAQNLNEQQNSEKEKEETHSLSNQANKILQNKDDVCLKKEEKLLSTVAKLKDKNLKLEEEIKILRENYMSNTQEPNMSLTKSKDAEFRTGSLPVPPSSSSGISEDCISDLKDHIDLLLERQKVWEEEKSTYRDMLASLEKDRLFYREMSENKHSEVQTLQECLGKLKEEIQSLNLGISSLPQQMPPPACQSCPPKKYLENSSQTKSNSATSTVSDYTTSPTVKKSPRSERKTRRTSRKEPNSYLKKPLLNKRPTTSSEENSSPDNHPNSSDTGETQPDSVHDRLLGGKKRNSHPPKESSSPRQNPSKKGPKGSSPVKLDTPTSLEAPSCDEQKETNGNSQPSTDDYSAEPALSPIPDIIRKRESDAQSDQDIADTLISADEKHKEHNKSELENILDGHVTRTKMLETLKKDHTESSERISIQDIDGKQSLIANLRNLLEGHKTRIDALTKLTKSSTGHTESL